MTSTMLYNVTRYDGSSVGSTNSVPFFLSVLINVYVAIDFCVIERVLSLNCASFVFPAVKGFQAKREYFTSMVPLEVIPKIFQFVDEELPPEIRAQRILNRARIPEIRDYILKNPDNYVFSSMTVSVDGGMEFIPLSEDEPLLGHITISMSAKFLINDGQHRQAAIAEAIKKNPELKNEHISVVFYRDEGLVRSQQMFSDLNRYAIRPTKSINILFNSREESSIIAKRVIDEVDVFHDMTEKEHTSVSNRSKALFTLSAICSGTEALLKDLDLGLEEKSALAIHFWEQVSKYIPFWTAVKNGQVKSSDVRKNTICTLSITLNAIGAGGNQIIRRYPNAWETHLCHLAHVDWNKTNPVWENLVLVHGKVATNRTSQRAMATYIENIMTEEVGG